MAPHPDLGPLFELSADALVVQDVASGRIVLWNHAAERLFGYSSSQAIGKPISIVLPPSVARLHQERLAHFARSGEPEVLTGRDALQIPAIQRGGDEIRVELSTAPLEWHGAHLLLLTFRDARSNKRAELQVLELVHAEAALAEALARLDARERLLADVPRELSGALANLRRSSTRLSAAFEGGDVDAACRLARVVDARTERVQQLAADLADAAALETGAFELNLDRSNLVPALTQLVADARRRARAHQLKLGAPQGLTAIVDVQRIGQVISSVIDAAVRRNPRGCWIDVDLRRPLGGLARIEIRDYGRALSPRELSCLPGGSAPTRSWQVLAAIVHLHGGRLCVEPAPEGGCRVVVTVSTNGGRVTVQGAQSSACAGPA